MSKQRIEIGDRVKTASLAHSITRFGIVVNEDSRYSTTLGPAIVVAYDDNGDCGPLGPTNSYTTIGRNAVVYVESNHTIEEMLTHCNPLVRKYAKLQSR